MGGTGAGWWTKETQSAACLHPRGNRHPTLAVAASFQQIGASRNGGPFQAHGSAVQWHRGSKTQVRAALLGNCAGGKFGGIGHPVTVGVREPRPAWRYDVEVLLFPGVGHAVVVDIRKAIIARED